MRNNNICKVCNSPYEPVSAMVLRRRTRYCTNANCAGKYRSLNTLDIEGALADILETRNGHSPFKGFKL